LPSTKNFITERDALATRLAHSFADPKLLEYALTHKSFGSQRSKKPSPTSIPPFAPLDVQANQAQSDNERLEFLGDAVLGMVIANQLYTTHPELAQDGLSLIRASLVNKDALALIARELELGRAVRLGAGELRSGGHDRSSILADALEAVIGAVFLDGGYDAAREFILRLFARSLANAVVVKDAKTQLQEWLQANGDQLPQYSVEEITGADHARQYQVRCSLPGREEFALGGGRSRRAAEQAAATEVLLLLNTHSAQLRPDPTRVGKGPGE